MKLNETLNIERDRKPLYELRFGSRGRKYELVAKIYYDFGNRNPPSKEFSIIDFIYLGKSKIVWRDSRGYFPFEELEKILLDVEKEYKTIFSVNAFLFTRPTGRTKLDEKGEALYECPIEFFNITIE